jgi:hypothetical protein
MKTSKESLNMPEMGKYCKAYLAERFQAYSAWKPNLENLRQEEKVDASEKGQRITLQNDDVLYLQENYVVTDGIFKDKNIIFDNVTDEWKEFCEKTLEFDPVAYLVEDSSHLTMH